MRKKEKKNLKTSEQGSAQYKNNNNNKQNINYVTNIR